MFSILSSLLATVFPALASYSEPQRKRKRSSKLRLSRRDTLPDAIETEGHALALPTSPSLSTPTFLTPLPVLGYACLIVLIACSLYRLKKWRASQRRGAIELKGVELLPTSTKSTFEDAPHIPNLEAKFERSETLQHSSRWLPKGLRGGWLPKRLRSGLRRSRSVDIRLFSVPSPTKRPLSPDRNSYSTPGTPLPLHEGSLIDFSSSPRGRRGKHRSTASEIFFSRPSSPAFPAWSPPPLVETWRHAETRPREAVLVPVSLDSSPPDYMANSESDVIAPIAKFPLLALEFDSPFVVHDLGLVESTLIHFSPVLKPVSPFLESDMASAMEESLLTTCVPHNADKQQTHGPCDFLKQDDALHREGFSMLSDLWKEDLRLGQTHEPAQVAASDDYENMASAAEGLHSNPFLSEEECLRPDSTTLLKQAGGAESVEVDNPDVLSEDQSLLHGEYTDVQPTMIVDGLEGLFLEASATRQQIPEAFNPSIDITGTPSGNPTQGLPTDTDSDIIATVTEVAFDDITTSNALPSYLPIPQSCDSPEQEGKDNGLLYSSDPTTAVDSFPDYSDDAASIASEETCIEDIDEFNETNDHRTKNNPATCPTDTPDATSVTSVASKAALADAHSDPDLLPLPELPATITFVGVITQPFSKVEKGDSRPGWQIRADDAPPLGLSAISLETAVVTPTSMKHESSLPGDFPIPDVSKASKVEDEPVASTSALEVVPSQSTPRRRKAPSPIDIALAMQLRPGLGIGADTAWMVRFLMSMFGWFAVLLSGSVNYN